MNRKIGFAVILIHSIQIQPSFAKAQKPPAPNEATTTINQKLIRLEMNNKLEFIDKNGNLKKELKLGIGVEGRPEGKSQYVERSAKISKDENRAVYIESADLEYAEGVPRTHDEPMDTSRIQVFDKNGEVIWSKDLPKFRAVRACELSSDGSVLATIQHLNDHFNHPKDPYEQLVVYNGKGEEVFVFPKRRGLYRLETDIRVSISGRYVALMGNSENYRRRQLIILNIYHGKIWEKESQYFVYKVLDDGIAVFSTADTSEGPIKFEGNLKPINE